MKTNPKKPPLKNKGKELKFYEKNKKNPNPRIEIEIVSWDEGIFLHGKDGWKIFLNDEGLTKDTGLKIQYQYVRARITFRPALIEIDVKYVPQTIDNKQYYQ